MRRASITAAAIAAAALGASAGCTARAIDLGADPRRLPDASASPDSAASPPPGAPNDPIEEACARPGGQTVSSTDVVALHAKLARAWSMCPTRSSATIWPLPSGIVGMILQPDAEAARCSFEGCQTGSVRFLVRDDAGRVTEASKLASYSVHVLHPERFVLAIRTSVETTTFEAILKEPPLSLILRVENRGLYTFVATPEGS